MLFLGTAAAECYPNPFCECAACQQARLSPDRRLKRRRSSMLFDEQTLIDFNADTMFACAEFGVSLNKVDQVLITHMHEDHFDYFNTSFLNMSATPVRPITFYVSEAAYAGMQGLLRAVQALPHPLLTEEFREMARISSFVALPAYQTTTIGNLQVTPVLANHRGYFKDEDGYNYLIEKDSHTTFYASDTGRFFDRTMQFLKKCRVDTLIIEGSFGKTIMPPNAGHLDRQSLCDMLNQMFAYHVLDARSKIYVTHIGHKGGYNLTDYQEYLNARFPGQVQIAWDGLEI